MFLKEYFYNFSFIHCCVKVCKWSKVNFWPICFRTYKKSVSVKLFLSLQHLKFLESFCNRHLPPLSLLTVISKRVFRYFTIQGNRTLNKIEICSKVSFILSRCKIIFFMKSCFSKIILSFT